MYMPVGATKEPDSHENGSGGTSAYESALNAKKRYEDAANRARRLYGWSEVALLVFAAAVPIAGLLVPGDARWSAILGAIVTIFSGLRAVFHWRDNWTRFSVAYTQLLGELRLYTAKATPYDGDDQERDAHLAIAVNAIETTETIAWSKLPGPGDSQPKDAAAAA